MYKLFNYLNSNISHNFNASPPMTTSKDLGGWNITNSKIDDYLNHIE